ncbi:hypothetical protein [Glaciimonas sp. PCH181]|uniref:hypothetical protein n=1 Tax=Glaciimonas sp. PCH181 TaxID=2133943 RepID=UPI0011B1E4AF|nr:hypothetical protein [Glaciimonas sp. PCH181]
MHQYIVVPTFYTLFATLTLVVFHPFLCTKSRQDLKEAFNVHPALATPIPPQHSPSYTPSCIYLGMALVAYAVIAIGNDVEIDINLAISSLIILFALTHIHMSPLRALLDSPENRPVHS